MGNEAKPSYVMYVEWEEIMEGWSDAERGRFQRLMVRHLTEGWQPSASEPMADDLYRAGEMSVAWKMFTAQMDRDAEKWIEIRKKRSRAGANGGRTRAENRKAEAASADATPAKIGRCAE